MCAGKTPDRVPETGGRPGGRGRGVAQEDFLNFVTQPLFDAEGRVDGVLTFGVDVTEQVRARRLVEEQAVELEAYTEELEFQAVRLEETQADLEVSNEELEKTNKELITKRVRELLARLRAPAQER